MTTTMATTKCGPKAADFASCQEVRWCPGCGDYAVLANVRKVLAKLQFDKSKTVFVSGIGCSSRFPYYMSTYGFHSIHGRAATLATGLKLARPDLSVWIVTGDGDALAIGGNHFLHLIRRNLDVKILVFNNRIYGLTKGQYSPTSERGKKTKSSPEGTPEEPVRPISVAIGSESTFAARALDTDGPCLENCLERAAKHKGTALVEVYQNCVIFNDGAFNYLGKREERAERLLYMEHGKPMVYGKNRDKGIRLKGMTPEIVSTAEVPEKDLLVHDEHCADPSLAFMLSRMRYPEFPEPVGVFRDVQTATYDETVYGQIAESMKNRGKGEIQKLLATGSTWTIGG